MPRRANMAVSIRYDFPSDEMLLRGFQKSPIVLLNRLKVNHLLNNVRVKYNKNGSVVPYSTDVAQHRILRKILLDCTVDLVKIDSMNVDSVTKEGKTQNDANDLLVIDTVKKKRGRPRIYKNIEKSYTGKQRNNKTRKNRRKQHKCKECNKIFKNLNCFKIHCRFKHVSGNYECAHCSKKYKRQTFFERHINLHCNICYVLQQNERQLLEHIAICRNSEQVDNQTVLANKYTCELCIDQFDTNCAITYHKALIHSDNPPSIKDLYYIRFFGSTKVYVCYFCKESSVDKDYLESHVTVLRNMNKNNANYPSDQRLDSFDVEHDLLQHKTLHTITDSNSEAAQYEDKRSSLDTTDSIPMLLQDENINDLNPETNNAVTNVEKTINANVEISINTNIRVTNAEKPSNTNNVTTNAEKPSNTNNLITNEEKLSDINNLISNAEKFTNNVGINNIVENPNNKDPERNDAAQSHREIPTSLENVEYELQIQSTVQNRDLNKSTDSNMNGLTNGTRKKTIIQSDTQIMRYRCKMCEKYFTTNFALLRHMKVHHILQSLSCKLCKQVLSESSQIHKCPEIERVRTKLETESTDEHRNDTFESMDIEYQVPKPLPIDRFPVVRNMKSLQEDLVFNIVVREVPVEFYSV